MFHQTASLLQAATEQLDYEVGAMVQQHLQQI
jgi:hypothetical protein